MTASERDALVKSRLRGAQRRNESALVVLDILRGQISAQQRELSEALNLLNEPVVLVGAAPMAMAFRPSFAPAA